ncbi:MAG TPA: hypothetical protein VLV32_04290 [Burkholderiales bacterium]|nr:hypothetical protein [Burkholderiales bacterium]
MHYMPGEKILFESKSTKLVLTTHRVRFESRTLGRKLVTSFMLEEIVSCNLIYRNHPSFIGVGIVFGIAGFYLVRYVDFAWAIGLTFMALCLLAYLATIERAVVLSSSNAVMNVPLGVLGDQDPIEFIDEVETAKNARYVSTKKMQQEQNYPKPEMLDTRREPSIAPTSFRNSEGR